MTNEYQNFNYHTGSKQQVIIEEEAWNSQRSSEEEDDDETDDRSNAAGRNPNAAGGAIHTSQLSQHTEMHAAAASLSNSIDQ